MRGSPIVDNAPIPYAWTPKFNIMVYKIQRVFEHTGRGLPADRRFVEQPIPDAVIWNLMYKVNKGNPYLERGLRIVGVYEPWVKVYNAGNDMLQTRSGRLN